MTSLRERVIAAAATGRFPTYTALAAYVGCSPSTAARYVPNLAAYTATTPTPGGQMGLAAAVSPVTFDQDAEDAETELEQDRPAARQTVVVAGTEYTVLRGSEGGLLGLEGPRGGQLYFRPIQVGGLGTGMLDAHNGNRSVSSRTAFLNHGDWVEPVELFSARFYEAMNDYRVAHGQEPVRVPAHLLPPDRDGAGDGYDGVHDVPASGAEVEELVGVLRARAHDLATQPVTVATPYGEVSVEFAPPARADENWHTRTVGTVTVGGRSYAVDGHQLLHPGSGRRVTSSEKVTEALASIRAAVGADRDVEERGRVAALLDPYHGLEAFHRRHKMSPQEALDARDPYVPAGSWSPTQSRRPDAESLRSRLCALAALTLDDPAARSYAAALAKDWSASPRDLVASVAAAML